jgi:hypothetical protein
MIQDLAAPDQSGTLVDGFEFRHVKLGAFACYRSGPH